MHIDTNGIDPGSQFLLIGLWVLLGLIALVGLVLGLRFGFGFIVDDERPLAGVFALVAGLVVAAAAIIPLVLSAANNSVGNDRVHNELRAQASARYGVALNGQQAADLIDVCTNTLGTGSYECGSTYILTKSDKPLKVTLYHVGDVWLLGKGSESKQFTELPRV